MNRDNYLLIYCHPNPKSFTNAVLQQIVAALQASQKEYYILDLYQTNFNPVLVVNATRRRRDMILDSETAEYRRLIMEYDNHIYVYPVWWGSFPALLKGFIDRTFVSGLTYTFEGKPESSIFPTGLMKSKKAYFVYSLDSPFLVGLIDPGWLAIKYTIFKYCGFSQVKRLYLSGLKRKSAMHRAQWLQRVKRYFSQI